MTDGTERMPAARFLEGYRLEPALARSADPVGGLPALRHGVDPDREPVLVCSWSSLGPSIDAGLRRLWRHELRALYRLGGYLSPDSYIAPLASAGTDDSGFHIAVQTDGQRLYADIIDTLPFDRRSTKGRAWCWRNLMRLAKALQFLHSHGLAHRRLDGWAVLTSATDDVDFRLTGFEWSSRSVRPIDGVFDPLVAANHALTRDWQDLGHFAVQTLGVNASRLSDPLIPAVEVDPELDPAEIHLLRDIVDVREVDPTRLLQRIDTVVTRLDLASQGRAARLILLLQLGRENALTRAIHEASEREIALDDVENQRIFVEEDLGRNAFVVKVQDFPYWDRLISPDWTHAE